MQITKVSVTYGRKLGDPRPGKFGSLDNSIVLEATLDEGDDPEAVIAALHEMAKRQVKEFSVAWMRQVTHDLDDIFEHLPAEVQALITGEEQ